LSASLEPVRMVRAACQRARNGSARPRTRGLTGS
jgi:hypothetical protein